MSHDKREPLDPSMLMPLGETELQGMRYSEIALRLNEYDDLLDKGLISKDKYEELNAPLEDFINKHFPPVIR